MTKEDRRLLAAIWAISWIILLVMLSAVGRCKPALLATVSPDGNGTMFYFVCRR